MVAWPIAVAAALLLLAPSLPAAATKPVAPASVVADANQKLLQAIEQADQHLLEKALKAGADPNCRGTNSLPPLLELFRAATGPLDEDHRDCVALLLEYGAAVDAKDADQRTPLIQAARIGDLKTVQMLVEAEATVIARDRFSKSALFYAVDANRRDIVVYLATHGDLVSLTIRERKALGQPLQ